MSSPYKDQLHSYPSKKKRKYNFFFCRTITLTTETTTVTVIRYIKNKSYKRYSRF